MPVSRARTSRIRRKSPRPWPPTLAKAGINVKLQTVDWTTYLDKRKNGQLPLYMLGWTGDNGDPDNFVCYFFCLDAKNSPTDDRGLRPEHPAVRSAEEGAVTTVKQADRAPMYQQAEQMIHDQVLRIFIANNQPPLAFTKKVSGYIVNPTGTEYFNTVAVAP